MTLLRSETVMRKLCVAALVAAGLAAGGPVAAKPGAPTSAPAAAAGVPADFEARIAAAKAVMMADPDQALTRARAALALLSAPDGDAQALAAAKARWLEGEALVRLNRPDEAAPAIDAALHAAERLGPRSKLHGDLLMSRASIRATKGQVSTALHDFHQAHDIFRGLGEARSQAIALQNIGSIYREARDFERVLKYYDQSAAAFASDPALNVAAFNNRGNAHKELGRLDAAEAEFRQALAVARQMDSPLLQVRILNNIASAQYLRGELGKADATADAALRMATGPAANWRPFLWGVKAQVALKRGDLRGAERLVRQTFAGADLATTTMPYREFHQTAKDVYARLGDAPRALAHLEAFKRLDDEAREVAASANSALMGARFDFKNQQLQIAELKAGQLQRDVQLAQANQRMLVGLLGASAALILLGLLSYLSVRRSRNQVSAANIELSRTNEQLARALQARSQLLATTSHEIRTPLNGIVGMTEVLLADPQVEGRLRDRLEVVRGAGATMKALVDDILDVAKMETGRISVHKEAVELRGLFVDASRLWADAAEAKGLRLVSELDACPERAVTDARRLRQIVLNLMSNAVKFTDSGTVTLAVSAHERDGAERLCVRVSDTGVGIPAEHLERVFDSFHQVDTGTSRRHGGTGLGLAICRDLARALGGEVRDESAPGVGSTFVLELPLERPQAPDAPVETSTAAGGQARTLADSDVLLVVANPLTRSLVRALLNGRVRALEAADGQAAPEALRARAFDHLVVDQAALPGGSLEELAQAAPDAGIVLLHDDDAEELAHPRVALRVPRSRLAEELADALQALATASGGAEPGDASLVTAA